mmetsp:Transcript_4140/g.7005  ORF Transcript_4140/g.7005 Transcript_4140/m.7005 type:complete len:146 (+) Transcript_4140:23-460(+)
MLEVLSIAKSDVNTPLRQNDHCSSRHDPDPVSLLHKRPRNNSRPVSRPQQPKFAVKRQNRQSNLPEQSEASVAKNGQQITSSPGALRNHKKVIQAKASEAALSDEPIERMDSFLEEPSKISKKRQSVESFDDSESQNALPPRTID